MNLIRILLIIGMITMVKVQTLAQEKPPEGGKPKNFNLPEPYNFELANGIKATLVNYGAIPKVNVSLVIRAGNINEASDEVWLADMTGEMLKEGTKNRTSEQIAEQAAGMGGSVNVSVGADQTFVAGEVLSEFAPKLIDLISDIVQNPLLPEQEIKRLQNDFIRNLSIEKSTPGSLALEKFRKVLYPDHPYGRTFPSEEMIKSFTAEKIRKFYKDNFNASRARIFVVGQFDKKEAENTIREAFNNWNKGEGASEIIPRPKAEKMIYLINRPGAPQSNLYIGLPVIDPTNKDYVPLLVMNALLGGSFSSRITSNIRENKGYTYSPSSSVSSRYRDAYWAEVADVTTNFTGASLKEIFHEIDSLQNTPPSKQELEGIQNYLAGVFVLQNSSRQGIINQLAFINLHGLDRSYLTDYVKNVYAVTPEEIQRVAKKYIQKDKMTIVIVGDESKVREQVAPYGTISGG
jgi:predicted Zn-dependent peptidase